MSFAFSRVDRDDPEVGPILADVLAACERAARLTQQLLTFASGGFPIRKPTSLAELVRATVDFALRGSSCRAVYRIPPDSRPVDIDPSQVSQVLTNLIINADEATPGGGLIEVRCANRSVTDFSGLGCPAGEYVEIAVSDRGVGIAPEAASRLFEPFFSTKQRGSGLGLATAYSIIKKHDGALTFESRPEGGATFRILLPITSGQPDAQAEEGHAPQLPVAAAPKHRVLLMDDEQALRTALCRMLRNLGSEVEDAAEGADAVSRFVRARERARPFDIVVLDITVRAGLGGLETLEQLRRIDSTVCAIAISGYAPHPVLATPQEYGFFAALPKPFRTEELGLLIQRASQRDRAEDPNGANDSGSRHAARGR